MWELSQTYSGLFWLRASTAVILLQVQVVQNWQNENWAIFRNSSEKIEIHRKKYNSMIIYIFIRSAEVEIHKVTDFILQL